MTPKDLISAARIRVTNRHPYVAAVLLSLKPVEKPGLGTMAVDASWRLYYDPAKVVEWGVGSHGHDGVAGVLAHEVWHCLKDHVARKQDREHDRWNRAADREINDDLVAAGWKLPAHDKKTGQPLLPAQIGCKNGDLAEVYYEKEPKEPKQESGGAGQAILAPGCGGKCGGCAGNPHDFEESSQGRSGPAGSAPPTDGGSQITGIDPADQEILRRQVAEAVQAHAKSRGTVPAGLRAWADAELSPAKIDWRRQLANLVRGAIAERSGASDYTYRRPSRRQWGMRKVFGVRAPIMPALRQPLPEVGIVLDTSGSMLGKPLQDALSEVVGIIKALGAPCKAWAVDAAVHAAESLVSARDVEKLNKGGGGTDMRVGIALAEKSRVNLIIVLTDGLTPWPNAGEGTVKVLAAVTPGGARPPEHIPCVMIDDC